MFFRYPRLFRLLRRFPRCASRMDSVVGAELCGVHRQSISRTDTSQKSSRRRSWQISLVCCAVGVISLPPIASADLVRLSGGTTIEGIVMEQTPSRIKVQVMWQGVVSLDPRSVVAIEWVSEVERCRLRQSWRHRFQESQRRERDRRARAGEAAHPYQFGLADRIQRVLSVAFERSAGDSNHYQADRAFIDIPREGRPKPLEYGCRSSHRIGNLHDWRREHSAQRRCALEDGVTLFVVHRFRHCPGIIRCHAFGKSVRIQRHVMQRRVSPSEHRARLDCLAGCE